MPVRGTSQASIKSFFGSREPSSTNDKSSSAGPLAGSSQPTAKVAQRSSSWWSAKDSLGAKPGAKVDFGSGRPQLKRMVGPSETSQPPKRKSAISRATGNWNSRPKPTLSHSPAASLSAAGALNSASKRELSSEQVQVMNMIKSGHSLFYTGAAGTGKSYLLTKIIQELKILLRDSSRIAVCATTGLAGKNIGGTTIHAWSGMGTFKESAEFYIKKHGKSFGMDSANYRWKNTQVLIIDEVSMLPASSFEKLDKVARGIRKINKPFGGIQVVLTGDFFQLPPIVQGAEKFHFCFEVPIWKELIGDRQIVLHKVFRQKSTDKLTGMLNEIRLGKVSAETIDLFKQLEREVVYNDGLEATRIYPRRNQVDIANRQRLDALPGKSFKLHAMDLAHTNFAASMSDPFKDHISQKVLELKIGAQVLMIMNRKEMGLVNGSRGAVVSFMSDHAFCTLQPIMEKYGRDKVVELYNMVLENNEMSNQAIDEKMSALLEPEEKSLILELVADTIHGEKAPLVDFPGTGWVVVERETFENHGPPPKSELLSSREQYPLILNYALSIHKAQGQTIDRLIVDLSSTFENGQAYVAVSRATCFDRLQVKGFTEGTITANPKVIEFYNELVTV